jgi:hypothetical protein
MLWSHLGYCPSASLKQTTGIIEYLSIITSASLKQTTRIIKDLRIIRVPAEIRTCSLQNANQKCSILVNLLGF